MPICIRMYNTDEQYSTDLQLLPAGEAPTALFYFVFQVAIGSGSFGLSIHTKVLGPCAGSDDLLVNYSLSHVLTWRCPILMSLL